jgi:hypothetical protein
MRPADFLPAQPLSRIIVRHTVGLSDPLTNDEISAADRANDGLPESLDAVVREYGITHLKIKLAGDPEADRERLARVATLCPRSAFTLDGNENYRAVEPFRALWESLRADSRLTEFLKGLIFVEQPLHRDAALAADTARALLAWKDRPPIIIDESDGEAGTLALALECGYAGTSHKNCKGVFKGLANAALIAQWRRNDSRASLHLSAEDLSNVGPVALTQDLAVIATLGIPHAERNGHHYFAGLSQFPAAIQDAMVGTHGDLFERKPSGFAAVRIGHGSVTVGSVVAAPFGYTSDVELETLATQ